MPIVFQQPEPLRGDISQGYGAAQQWSQDFPMLQRQQQGIADAYLHSAALAQRASQASAQNQAQAQMHAASLDQQSYMGEQQAALQRQQMAHQSDMQSQHAQLQDQLAQNQLSRGEQMRLQRLQEARGTVQQMLSTGELSQEQASDAMMQIQTGISPLQQRQQRAQTLMQQTQHEAMQRQVAQFDQLQRERDEYRSGGIGSHIGSFMQGGDERRVWLGENGQVDWHTTALVFGHQYGGGEHAANPRGGVGGQAGGASGGTAVDSTSGTSGGAGRNAPSGREWHQLTHAEQRGIIDHVTTDMNHERDQTRATATQPAGERAAWMDNPAQWDAQRDLRVAAYMRSMNQGRPATQTPTPGQNDEQVRSDAIRQFNLRHERLFNTGRLSQGDFQANRGMYESMGIAGPGQVTQDQLRHVRSQHAQLAVLGAQLQRQNQAAAPRPLVQTQADLGAVRQYGTREMTPAEIDRLPEAARPAARELRALSTRAFTGEEIGRMPEAARPRAEQWNLRRQVIGQEGSRDADGRPLTAERRASLMRDVNYGQQLLVQYGTVAAMPQAVRHVYDNAVARTTNVQSGQGGPPQTDAQREEEARRWREENSRIGLVGQYGPGLAERFQSGLGRIGNWARQSRLTPPPTQSGG